MRLVQFLDDHGERGVGAVVDERGVLHRVGGARSVRDLALEVHRAGRSLQATVEQQELTRSSTTTCLFAGAGSTAGTVEDDHCNSWS